MISFLILRSRRVSEIFALVLNGVGKRWGLSYVSWFKLYALYFSVDFSGVNNVSVSIL